MTPEEHTALLHEKTALEAEIADLRREIAQYEHKIDWINSRLIKEPLEERVE